MRRLLASRSIERVVVLGANGTMGYGSAALFTQAVPHVTFLARTRAKAVDPISASEWPCRTTASSCPHVSIRACRRR